MCIAIYKSEGVTLNESTLENCWDANSDGAGFMYAEKGKVVIEKGFMTYEAFRRAYDPHASRQLALHFRIATHGGVNAENTHPFRISDTLGMIHNGIINRVNCDIDKKMSDTWHFAEKFMKPYENFWQEPEYKELIEAYIGFSKLVLLSGDGDFEIYNEKEGHWNTDCWFSNTSWQTKSYSYGKKSKSKSIGAWNGVGYGDAEEETCELRKYHKPKIGESAFLKYMADVDKPAYQGQTIFGGSKVFLDAFGDGNMVWVKTTQGLRAKVPLWHLEMWEYKQEEEKEEIKPAETVLLLPEKKDKFNVVEKDVFEVGKEVVFSHNYNHFRIGMVKSIQSVSDKFVVVKEENKGKSSYLIPKSVVTPVYVMLH